MPHHTAYTLFVELAFKVAQNKLKVYWKIVQFGLQLLLDITFRFYAESTLAYLLFKMLLSSVFVWLGDIYIYQADIKSPL